MICVAGSIARLSLAQRHPIDLVGGRVITDNVLVNGVVLGRL
jgi:hypothetical protein